VDLGLLGIDDLSREIRPPPLEAGQASGQSASVDTVAPPGWYRNDDDWGMVGRDDAMHALSQVLLRTREGSGQMIVITGEAGIGKTRLCRQMMTTAWTHGYTVLLGHCNGRGLSEPFVPMIEAIRNHLAVSDVRSIRRTLGSGYRELQRFFPQLDGSAAIANDTDLPETRSPRLYEEMVDLLSALAGDAGLLLVVEDLHWSDVSTQRLLTYLARRVRSTKIAIVGTFRSDEVELHDPLHAQVRAWARLGTLIQMGPLTAEQVSRLAQEIMDVEVAEDLQQALYIRSGGNPYAVGELLKAMVHDGGSTSLPNRLPANLRDATLVRLRALDSEQIEVLRVGSVLGTSFDLCTLAAVVETDSEAVHAGVMSCVNKHLLAVDSPTGDSFRFRHDLMKHAVYESLPTLRCKELHERAARVLQCLRGSSAEVAHHLFAAGSNEEAVRWCWRAAEVASERRAYATAAELYELALAHVRDHLLRASLQCELGTARLMAGDTRRAEQPLVDGIDALEWLGKDVMAAHHRLTLARIHCGLARIKEAQVDYTMALTTLRGHEPTVKLADRYLRLAACMTDAGRPVAVLARRAIRIGEQLGEKHLVLRGQAILAPERLYNGEVHEGLQMLDAAVSGALELGLDDVAQNATFHAVIHHAHLNPAGARQRLERLVRLDVHSGTSAVLAATMAHYETIIGNHPTALDLLERATEVFRSQRATAWRRWTEAQMAVVQARLGRFDEARRWTPLAGESRVHRAITAAMVASDLDEPDRGTEIVEVSRNPEHTPATLHAMVCDLAVNVLIALGRPDEARAIALVMPGPRPDVTDAHFRLMVDARLALAEDDLPAAEDLLFRAIRELERIGCEEYERDARLLLTDVLDKRGSRRSASEQLMRVIDGARRRGSVLQQQRAGLRAGATDLTMREREVARLVAAGMTDRQVAEQLGLSTRTVESHLANIRGKLGALNRTQVAGWVSARKAANVR
jgi:DNA-binding CsgD family transcriptional regulator